MSPKWSRMVLLGSLLLLGACQIDESTTQAGLPGSGGTGSQIT
jgi:hypothetical protein